MPVSNPIPSNQIVDINLEWTCGNEPECPTLDNVLQAILEEVCDKEPMIDLNELNFDACFGEVPGTTLELLQGLITNVESALCPDEVAADIDITGLNLCDSDNWDCDSELQCIPMVDECNNPVEAFTIKQLFQAMIARMMAYQDKICSLETRIETLETNYTTLESRADVIEANCCDITLVNRVTEIETVTIPDLQSQIDLCCVP